MSFFLALRNATKWAGLNLGREDGASAQAVAVANADTGTPVNKTAPLPTSPLRSLGTARSLSVSGATNSVALTTTCTTISMIAVGCAMRVRVGTGAQTAVATDHYLSDGERIEIYVPENAVVAALAASGSGTLNISELV